MRRSKHIPHSVGEQHGIPTPRYCTSCAAHSIPATVSSAFDIDNRSNRCGLDIRPWVHGRVVRRPSPPIRPFDPGRIPSDSGKESRGGGREESIRTNVLEVSGHVEAGPPRFRHVMQDRDASFQQAKVVVDRSKKRSLEEIFGITWATCDGSGSKGKSRHV